MSYIDRTKHIHKRGNNIWYVDKNNGSDSNPGNLPDLPFETIGAGITALGAGDVISVATGTYTETGLDLDTTGCEIWFEHGVILDPASGTCLTVSGTYCGVRCDGGSLFITPASTATGVVVSGANSYIHDVRVNCASSANIGFDITGNGVVLTNCRCADPLTAAFKVQGNKVKLEDCGCGGSSGDTSIGYWVTNSCSYAWLLNCASRGNETASFQVDTGCTSGVIKDCSSGGGDGRWSDADDSFVWSGFTYDGGMQYGNPVHATTTFSGAPTTYNIFTITGAVRVSNLYGIVETVIPNTASTLYLQLYSTNGTVDITNSPGTDIDSAAAGALLVRNGTSGTDIDLADPNTTPAVAENTSFRDPAVGVDLVKDDSATTYIRLVLSSALASGAIHWHCHWEPLSDDGYVEPA